MQHIVQKVLKLTDPANQRVQMCYLLFLSSLFIFVSERCFWADSEVWALKISGLEGEARQNFDYFIKPGFHFFLSPLYHFSQVVDLHHMVVARWVFAFNGLILLGLAAFILIEQTKSITSGWLLVVLGLSSWVYLEQGFRVRSDLLAMTIFLCHLILILKMFETSLASVQQVLLFYFLGLVALSLTPKIGLVYLAFFPLGAALFRRLKTHGNLEWLERTGLALLTLLTLWALSDSRFFVAVVRQLRNVRQSIFDGDGSVGVFSFYRFEHLIRFVIENPLILFLMLIKFFWILKNQNRWRQNEKVFYLDFGVSLALTGLLIFPDRMPWLIASYLPLFLIFSLNYPLTTWSEIEVKLEQRKLGVVITFGVLFSLAAWKTTDIHRSHNNDEQKLLATSIDDYQKAYPEVRVYDPAGITRHPDNYHFYLGPGDLQVNYWSAHLIKQTRPNVILSGQRLEWVRKFFGAEFLDAYWDPFRTGVYLRGQAWSLSEQSEESAIKGYRRVKASEDLLLAAINQAPHMELLHFRLNRWPHPPLGSIFLEFENGRLHPVTETGVSSDLYINMVAVHVPKGTKKIYLYRNPSYAFFQFSMPKLLRFDAEL